MRCFATRDGHVLVEWATSETGVLEPDRTPLDRAGLIRSVEIEGLRPLPPFEAPPQELVRAAIARHHAAQSEARARYDRIERERLAGFDRALPDLSPGERIALVWRYSGPVVVVARSTGEELWRDPDWPWMGKDLYRRLRRVAERKYGERLDAFAVDVPPEDYLRFDND